MHVHLENQCNFNGKRTIASLLHIDWTIFASQVSDSLALDESERIGHLASEDEIGQVHVVIVYNFFKTLGETTEYGTKPG